MLKITDTNYGHYKKVFEVVFAFIWREHPSLAETEVSPVNILGEWEKKSMSKAKTGLKTGLLDMLTQVKMEMTESDKLLLDKKLVEEGLPGLWKLMSINNEIPAKVLKRGKIKNLGEWYVVKEIPGDVDAGITKEDRDKLKECFHEFETNHAKKKKDI